MKRICAYMMAALLALSSVFCPAIPVLAEGEEIIDASGYGTMVEDVLLDRYSGMDVEKQIDISGTASETFSDRLNATLSDDEAEAFNNVALDQKDYSTGTTVSFTDAAELVRFASNLGDAVGTPDVASYAMSSRLLESGMAKEQTVMPLGVEDEIATIADAAGLEVNKEVVYDTATKSYKIQLEAYTTGTVTSKVEYIPTDVILVLDMSGSMLQEKLGSQTRLDALKDAAQLFVEKIRDQASFYEVDHRVALVTFGNGWRYSRFYDGDKAYGTRLFKYYYDARSPAWDPDNVSKWNLKVSTGVFKFNESKGTLTHVNYGAPIGDSSGFGADAKDACASAFVPMNVEDNYTLMYNTIDDLTTHSSVATFPHFGLQMANSILSQDDKKNDDRNRIVIVFSDGGPGYNTRWFDINNATSAINQAATTKNSATVYTIGVFSGANANSKGIDPKTLMSDDDGKISASSTTYKISTTKADIKTTPVKNVTVGNTTYYMTEAYYNDIRPLDATLTPANYSEYCNWLLQNISSNNGTARKPGYYLSAADSDALNDAFDSVFKSINVVTSKPNITLGTSTVVKDVISDYFKLPAGFTSGKVELKTVEYQSDGTFKKTELAAPSGVTASVAADGTVSVTGFNYDYYFCSKTKKSTGDKAYGRKLIIRFPIEPKEGFLGGNNVPTNKSTSGVYESSTATSPIETFPVPKADVAINVPDFTVTDKTVYYGTQVTPQELYEQYVAENPLLDDFVTISYVLPDGNTISPTECTEGITYKLQAKATAAAGVAGTSNGPDQPTTITDANTNTKTANVHVLVPEKTYEDSSIYLGQTADYTKNGADTAHTWIDQKGHTTYPAVTVTEPEVVFTYNPAEGAFEKDTPVNVTATIDGAEATNAVSFKWTDCTENHGSLPKIASPHLGSVDTPEFYVHILNNSLTITKTGLNQFVYTDGSDQESAIFTVEEEGGKGRTWTVAINGNGSVTLDGLYARATYTVKEMNNWTWRYEDQEARIMVLKAGENNAFVFENTLRNDKAWLNGDNYENNVFGNGAVSPTESIPPAGN